MATAMPTVTARKRPRPSNGTLAAEFLASLILGMFGYWAIFSGNNAAWSAVDGAMAFGIGLFVVALLLQRYDVHANTLLTVGALQARMVSGLEAALRSGAQLLGFIVALLLMWGGFGEKAAQTDFATPAPAPGIFWLVTLLIGALAGFCFVLAGLYAIYRMSPFVSAVVLGLSLYVAIFYSAHAAGGGINTARELASMLFYGYWPLWGTLGELLGACAAGFLYGRSRVA